jgi:hypothetical protein
MIFNNHSNLEGRHAFLGASKYHWINYDDNKLIETYSNDLAKERGTALHDLASRCIKLNQRLPKTSQTLNLFVNDAIGYKMQSEQPLYFSENCFGTADAISFRKNILRIHDLKTGETPAHMEQLYIYNALFCLEYHLDPHDFQTELRIYQNNEVRCEEPDPEVILGIEEKIKRFDKIIRDIQMKEGID